MAGRPREFPDIKPTSRRFTPGEYPQTMFRAQNGASIAVRFGNRQFESRLSLTFKNITDEEARMILGNYKDVNGNWDYVEFSSNSAMLDGTDDNFMQRQLRGESDEGKLKYRYAAPPEVDYVFMDRCNVSCELIGYLDGGLD